MKISTSAQATQPEDRRAKRSRKQILLWRLLAAAVVFYVDGRCDSADDERHAAADQVKPVGDKQAKADA